MTPHAPPAPFSLKKKQGNIAVIIHHQKHNREKEGDVRNREREIKTKKGIINHPKNLKKQLERRRG